jgi:hypothetical protein
MHRLLCNTLDEIVSGLAHPKKVIVGILFALGSYLPGVLLFAPPLHSQKQIAAIDYAMPDLS